MTITDALHQAVLKIPKKAWTPAYDAGGTERPGAWVAEITDMPDLSSWPKGMRRLGRHDELVDTAAERLPAISKPAFSMPTA